MRPLLSLATTWALLSGSLFSQPLVHASGRVATIESTNAGQPKKVSKVALKKAKKAASKSTRQTSQAAILKVYRGNATAEETALAEQAVKEDVRLDEIPYRSLGTPGDRDYQTRLSLADPGAGHLGVTLKNPKLLRGIILHNETIDREAGYISPYRAINPKANAVLRLHAGDKAPVSVYFGRPDYAPVYGVTTLRRAQYFARKSWRSIVANNLDYAVAMAGSTFFSNGSAEVKIAMSQLSAESAVKFMTRIKESTLSMKEDQTYSAAFNLNVPIVDDRPETLQKFGKPQLVQNPRELAILGAQLAKRAGWKKVAWDAASNATPTVPFLELLGGITALEPGEAADSPRRVEAIRKGTDLLVDIVAEAHSLGLETYISGGMNARHMQHAVVAGVDGVGIGTSLHDPSTVPNVLGPLNPDRIEGVLAARDSAEKSVLGRGAKALAALKFRSSTTPLSAEEEATATALKSALLLRDEVGVARALKGVASR